MRLPTWLREASGRATSDAHGRAYDLTLIEADVLDSLDLPAGRLTPEEARRNVVTHRT